jgi:FAD/FMN-containing dehydrogenase
MTSQSLNSPMLLRIAYDTEKKVVHLGPGQLWCDVYKKLADTDITVLGGRVSYVGVGGFTLGGGLSYLAGLHGLACDSLIDAQIVLADGSIKWASEDEDLLFALKGAGHAFGGKSASKVSLSKRVNGCVLQLSPSSS